MCAETELHNKRRPINPTAILAGTSAAGHHTL